MAKREQVDAGVKVTDQSLEITYNTFNAELKKSDVEMSLSSSDGRIQIRFKTTVARKGETYFHNSGHIELKDIGDLKEVSKTMDSGCVKVKYKSNGITNQSAVEQAF